MAKKKKAAKAAEQKEATKTVESKIFFVDAENVGYDSWKHLIGGENTFYVYFSKQCKNCTDCFRKSLGKQKKLYFVESICGEKNALDYQLIGGLSARAMEDKANQKKCLYYIISNDKGYIKHMEFLAESGICVKLIYTRKLSFDKDFCVDIDTFSSKSKAKEVTTDVSKSEAKKVAVDTPKSEVKEVTTDAYLTLLKCIKSEKQIENIMIFLKIKNKKRKEAVKALLNYISTTKFIYTKNQEERYKNFFEWLEKEKYCERKNINIIRQEVLTDKEDKAKRQKLDKLFRKKGQEYRRCRKAIMFLWEIK